MRKENAGFRTAFLSEEGSQLVNRDYFAYMELENFACYVAADSLDEEKNKNSAEIVVKTILREFSEHPSMAACVIKGYLKKAHKELQENNDGIRLRASVSMVITDYVKFRYASVGNSRAMLLRNDRILYASKDQSLTENLIEAERLPRDKAAIHEERNNLYSYLGQIEKRPELQVSGKKKLENGDVLVLCTRGIWENCTNAELLSCAREISTPQDLSDNVEDLILGKLKPEIDNYTIAVTFVDKVYLNPKKRLSLKKILAIVIPLAVLLLALLIALLVRRYMRNEKTEELGLHMEKAEEYVSYDNYEKAIEEYKEAEELAKDLKKKDEQEQIASCLFVMEQIMLADQAMEDGDYEKAQELYEKAEELSADAKDVGKSYLAGQQEKVKAHLELFELLEAGERKEEYGDYAGAIELYKKAKEKASDLYDKETRSEALEKQQTAEEALETLRQEELAALEEKIQEAIVEEQVAQELNNQSLMNDKENALELESKGNELMKNEDYLSAITYFETAMSMYEDLEMPGRVETLAVQIESCKKLEEEAKKKAAEEAAKQSEEEAAAAEAKQAAEEARQAAKELKDAEKDKALEEAKEAAKEAKEAAKEAKEAAKESSTEETDSEETETEADSAEETE